MWILPKFHLENCMYFALVECARVWRKTNRFVKVGACNPSEGDEGGTTLSFCLFFGQGTPSMVYPIHGIITANHSGFI